MPRSSRKTYRHKSKSLSKRPSPKLETVFECLSCTYGKTVHCKLDFDNMVGSLLCNVCGSTYSCAINQLSREVDVYGDWVDVWEDINTLDKIKRRQANAMTVRKPSSKHPIAEGPDAIHNLSIEMERTHIQPQAQSSTSTPKLNQAQTRVRSGSKNRSTSTTTAASEQQQLKLKERQRKHIRELDQTPVQIKGQGAMVHDDLDWDYSVLGDADLESDRGLDDEDHYDGSGSDMEFGD
ncbi:hypothetical protein BGX26_006768 [Mortierella sp. AD094]|nr:hypothetical protein BGX26_006768 [Mortierella sp. AD094]